MIPELGQFCLILALLMAVLQTYAGWKGMDVFCRRTARLQFFLCLAGFLALMISFITSDFTVKTVVENSHSLKPLLYKIAGVWGNHEGSMLLWVLILSLFGFLISVLPLSQREKEGVGGSFKTLVLSIQGLQGVGFLAFLLFASNPFTRIALPPIDGHDLNPLLQDPALAMHPPMLYFGYVGFSSVFSFAIAYLLRPTQTPQQWAASVRPWILLAWSGLSAGIALGSWWSYYELGWGGFWFWDPVENASLMPWLSGTALLHSIIVTQTRGAFPRWTLLLALITYSLSLLGTFLVRSGVLTSVHAFAVDPLRGLFILLLLGFYTGGGLLLYGLRAQSFHSDAKFQPLSRESALLLNNLFLITLCATVLIGTLYPLLLSTLNIGQISVGPPYFNSTAVPLAIPLFLLMGFGPYLSWKQSESAQILSQIKTAAGLTLAIVTLIWAITIDIAPGILLGLALAAWLFATSVTLLIKRRFRPFSIWGMAMAHAGMGLALAGMIGTSLWVIEQSAIMKPGSHINVGRYELHLDKVSADFGPNYSTVMATLTTRITDNDAAPFILTPERRHYPVAGTRTTETAIRKTWRDDIYVILGPQDKNGWVINAKVHPLVPMLWTGFMMIALGGLLSFISSFRRKLGSFTLVEKDPGVRRDDGGVII